MSYLASSFLYKIKSNGIIIVEKDVIINMINLKFEELAKYRQQNGHINLNHLITDNVDIEREVRGNDKRDKDWFDITGGRVMFKANTEEQFYAQYSELICCTLAKQAGLETAQYDFAEYKGKKGIITKHICKPGEELLTINDLIGSGPTNPDFPDNTDIYYIFEKLREKLEFAGYDESNIDKCMLDLRKQMLFDIYVMETDRHTENLSYIIGKSDETGRQTIRLAPMYDTEQALVLYDNKEYMQKVWSSMMVTANVTNMQEPKICVIPQEYNEEKNEDEEQSDIFSIITKLKEQVKETNYYATTSEEIWKTTLDFLCEDRRALEFVENTLSKMDITKAINELENEKSFKLPDEVKNMAIACFEDRKNAIAFEMGLDIVYDKEEKELT